MEVVQMSEETEQASERAERPDYGIGEVLDELPPKPKQKRGGARTSVFEKLLATVAKTHPDSWVKVGTYHTRVGAGTAARDLSAGKRKVPGAIIEEDEDGNQEVTNWEFANRLHEDVDTQESYLFAKFTGDPDTIELPSEDAEEDEGDESDVEEVEAEDNDAEAEVEVDDGDEPDLDDMTDEELEALLAEED